MRIERKADSFAKFFHDKINIIKRTTEIKNAVYNDNRKILVDNRFSCVNQTLSNVLIQSNLRTERGLTGSR